VLVRAADGGLCLCAARSAAEPAEHRQDADATAAVPSPAMPIFLRWLLRLGPLNPIAVRLVQGGSRRPRHAYIRNIYLGALIVCLLYMLMFATGTLSVRQLAASASSAFALVSYLQIALICLLAPVFMAGAIAQEANPRTWDILLTTPLGAAEIVLGNLLGRLFFILALLFSSLPLFAMTQYFGGVPGRTIFASYIIAACAALLVGAAAISLSVSRLVGKRAVFAFYISVVTYLAVTIAIDRIVGAGSGRVTWMTAVNPFLSLQALLDPTGYARAPEGSTLGAGRYFLERPVTTWCVLSTGVSLFLMVASTFTVRAGGLAGAGGAGGGGGGGVPWYRRMFGLGAKGAETRPARQVWSNPIAWREAAARNATFGRMLARWSFIAIGGLWGLGVVLYYAGGSMTTDSFRSVLLATVLGELGVVTLVALNMSATAVAREREDGTLDLLLTTPITPAAYLAGKVRGMVAYLLPLLAVPIATLLLAGIYVVLADAGMIHRQGGVTVPFTVPASNLKVAMPALLPEAGILAAVVTIPFAAFCCMVGLHWSLKSKGSIGSVVATVLVVGAISGVIGFCAFQAGETFDYVGPVIVSLSPGSLMYASIMPEDGLYGTVKSTGDLTAARVGLSMGAIIAAALMMAVVYGFRASLTHNFDMTVRKLAGTA
jgi:ABC-type transport system involved in multi-copper enzyme maturation permease subunit